jgi:fatty-acyl-CoA synthase
VALSHRTLYLHMLSISATFYNDETHVELHTIPLFHANGWGRPQCATFHGLTQVMVRRFDPAHVLRLIQEEKATSMSLVPTMANALLNCPELGQWDVSSMRQILLGGAASSPELVARMEAVFPCPASVGYGLTETSPVATSARDKSTVQFADEEDRLRRRAMTGWPLPGCEVRVVDLGMNDVPRDMRTFGEIVIRGDNVMDGYYKEPQATAAVMTNGWLHTGDMAVWDEENYIQIVDRQKDIIISGGENISSLEVEEVLYKHPDVMEAAVVAQPDAKWGETPHAFVTLKPGASNVSDADIIAWCRAHLAHFKCPRFVTFGSLPKTSTGKIQKYELREKIR